MIHFIGPSSTELEFQQFIEWITPLKSVELDVETTMSNYWCDKKLVTIQFGNFFDQWVLYYPTLTDKQLSFIKEIVSSSTILKIIHNAQFEAIILRFHGMQLKNVYDTMLCEQILTCGKNNLYTDEWEEVSLASLVWKNLNIWMDKSYQTSFTLNKSLSHEQIEYAAQDVKYLHILKRQQQLLLHQEDLEYVAALENDVVLVYAEMTYNGMNIDHESWLSNIPPALKLVEGAKKELDAYLTDPEFEKFRHLVSTEDTILINWNSPKQKKTIFEHAFPDLKGVTKPIIQKYLGTIDYDLKIMWTKFLDGDYTEMEKYLISHHKEWLLDNELLRPAGNSSINWNSQQQVLPIIQTVHPKAQSLNKEVMAKVAHPIAISLAEYKDSLKLITTYGEKFLQEHVEPDGKIRTSFNQIVSTGRISSRNPNMQNIPAKESVGNRYRNAFTCSDGWVFVDSDYSSQELVIIAHISQDPVWISALQRGEDLHSVCAELVFKERWRRGTLPDCKYKKSKQKCNCPIHKTLRTNVKTINFGLAYGMSKFKLSATARITVQEAAELIREYFRVFPKIGRALEFLGRFGVMNGYIKTLAPFYRKRWFDEHKWLTHCIDAHIHEVQYNPTLGEIERASKNQPIQGTAADMAKLSLVLIQNRIEDHRLPVKLVAQVHDQNTTICEQSFAPMWAKEMTKLMEEAALFIIPSGLLKAETNITDRWSK